MTTISLELAKRLYEKGLKLETEKVWIERDNGWVVEFTIRDRWFDMNFPDSIPAPSTDELLAILFSTGISRIGLSANSAWDDSAAQIIPKCFYGEISEALGLMCEWLLDNGWRWDEPNKLLVKGEG